MISPFWLLSMYGMISDCSETINQKSNKIKVYMKFFKYAHFYVNYVEHKVETPKGTILFLPGFGADCHGHGAQAHKVEGYDFYSISYPGHGHTIAHSSLDFSIELYTKIVVSFIEKKGLKDILLVGHSMGGAIAIGVQAHLAKHLVKRLLLISPLNSTIKTYERDLYTLFFPQSCSEYVETAREFHPHLDNYLKCPRFKQGLYKQIELANNDTMYSRGMKSLAAGFFDCELLSFLDNQIKRIDKPFWLFYGSLDNIINRAEIADHFTRLNSNCQTMELPEVDHSP